MKQISKRVFSNHTGGHYTLDIIYTALLTADGTGKGNFAKILTLGRWGEGGSEAKRGMCGGNEANYKHMQNHIVKRTTPMGASWRGGKEKGTSMNPTHRSVAS